jgi:hypothetical protein
VSVLSKATETKANMTGSAHVASTTQSSVKPSHSKFVLWVMSTISRNARIAGFVYLAASIVGLVRLMYIPKYFIVHGDAAATASRIASHELLFRFGIVSGLVGGVLWLFVPLALYRLLKDVDQGLAVVMVILGGLMQTPIFVVNTMTDAAALLFVRGADFLSVIGKPQRDAFVMLFLGLHHQLGLANAIFWGLWLIPLGVLVYRSRFLPRILGVWLILACFGWLAFCFAGLLFPQYESKVFSFGQIFTLGELVTMLWLMVVGTREPRPSHL